MLIYSVKLIAVNLLPRKRDVSVYVYVCVYVCMNVYMQGMLGMWLCICMCEY